MSSTAAPSVIISAPLQSVLDQCVDAFCFPGHLDPIGADGEGACFLDDDFRVHASADILASVTHLCQEQRRRVSNTFSAVKAPPDFHAAQLDELYGADAHSISRPQSEGSFSLNSLNASAARVFKKEMKQRIHEWEAAVKYLYGREPTPSDKASIRHIYELYKVVKQRVVGDGDGPSVEVPLSDAEPVPVVTPSNPAPPQAPAPVAYRPPPGAPVTPRTTRTSAAASPSVLSPALAASPSTTMPVHATPAGDAVVSQPAPSGAALEQLLAEKRRLKRRLHEFENSFRQQHNRQPTKDDRRSLQAEYARYGELKTLLATSD